MVKKLNVIGFQCFWIKTDLSLWSINIQIFTIIAVYPNANEYPFLSQTLLWQVILLKNQSNTRKYKCKITAPMCIYFLYMYVMITFYQQLHKN